MSNNSQNKGSTYSVWKQNYLSETKKDPLKDIYLTNEGIKVKPIYNNKKSEDWPGQFPFLRGPYASMYKGRPWTIRQYAGFSSAEESNKFYRNNLKLGQKGLSVAFDLATHRGYDSDHPRAKDDVGMSGVAIDSVEDMKALFKDIPLQNNSVSMTMNGAVLPVLASFIVAAEEQGVSKKQLTGTIQNDILKEFLVRNTYIYPPQPSMRITADIISFCAKEMPKYNSVSISGYHIQEAGATAVQELAFTLADGIEYIKAAILKGLTVEEFAPRLSFFFGVGMNFFMEVAKLRAARVLWSKIMANQFNATTKSSQLLRTHCQTSGVSLTAQDPYNNIIRTTIEAMAAVFGGTQSLHTNALDEAVALPTDFSARIARNTQLIIQNESAITKVVDPLAGSYYLEALTKELVEKAEHLLKHIEGMGGMVMAIASGYPKQEIEKIATERQARIDNGETKIIGVNAFIAPQDQEVDILKLDNKKIWQSQCQGLKLLRKNRNNDACKSALLDLKKASLTDSNLLPYVIKAIKLRATIGEVSEVLEQSFGRFSQSPKHVTGIYNKVLTENSAYNEVKKYISSFKAEFLRKPRIYIAKIGQDGHDRGSRVIASAFIDLGIEVISGDLFQNPEEVVKQAVSKNVDIIGISTLAGAHNTIVPKVLSLVKQHYNSDKGYPEIGVVIGGVVPKKDAQKLLQAGALMIYGPGTAVPLAAKEITSLIKNRLLRNR